MVLPRVSTLRTDVEKPVTSVKIIRKLTITTGVRYQHIFVGRALLHPMFNTIIKITIRVKHSNCLCSPWCFMLCSVKLFIIHQVNFVEEKRFNLIMNI